jgi:hypothetical protein
MSPTWSRLLRVLCVAYVTATLFHIAWVMAHEPFAFDAWNLAIDTKAQPFSVGRFLQYWSYEYTHSNPRIGQAFTYLSYKLDLFAVIATPLAYLALATGAVVLGIGRLPRRGRDLALTAIAIGFIWFAIPQIGKTLFNRAYGANYLYGAAIQMWFLVLLRIGRPRPVVYFLAGLVAGLCNEHTGPTLCAFMLGYAWWTQRKTGQRPLALWSAAAGTIAGFAALFFAPGQGERYDNLVQRVGLVGKLLNRGLTGNLDIVRSVILGAAPLLGLIVIVMLVGRRDADDAARRRVHTLIGLAMIACVTVAMTLFVSPKLGPRFFIMPLAVLLAGFIALAETRLACRQLIPFVVLAILASGYAALHTVSLYAHLHEASDARIAALEASTPGSVFTAESFEQVDDSWWFLGDDFRDIRKRELIARYFALEDVVFRAYDPDAPLGVSDVRLVGHADPVLQDGIELGWYRGLDVKSIEEALGRAIADLQRHVALKRLELAVHFVGEHPKLPRDKLLVGRWTPERFEAYTARIDRKPRHTEREITIPKELARADVDVFIYQVGGEARRLGAGTDHLQYVPWKTGAYWVLACPPGECFVLAAMRQAR